MTADTTIGWRERHTLTPLGIEHRAPFFDLRVVEMMASVPEWQKCHDGRFKAVLRDAEAGDVPDVISNRPDKGTFNSTIVDGLVKFESDRFKSSIEVLADSPLELIVDWEHLLERWGSQSLERELAWRAVTSGLWLQHGFNGLGDASSSRELAGTKGGETQCRNTSDRR